MELFREGQTLPATLPSGIHLDDWNLLGVPDGPKTAPKLPTNYGGTGWQQMQGNSQSTGSGRASGSLPGQSLAGRPELGTHAPFQSSTLLNRVDAVFEPKEHIMDYKGKAEYYCTKLQEIVLFKSYFDNKLAEITEQAAADKWE
ncbi:unnamed protein product, partial [Sphagnum compactum]